jgi:hypothetical protein
MSVHNSDTGSNASRDMRKMLYAVGKVDSDSSKGNFVNPLLHEVP